MHIACIAITTVLVLIPSLRLFADSPQVLVELSGTQVFVGESVHYRVLLNHCGMQAAPDMSKFENFEIRLVGRTQIQSTTISRGRRIDRIGPLYEYELTPRVAGKLNVPPPSVEIDGKTYVGQALTLTVLEVEAQDLVRLKVSTHPASVYPMQPFQIRLTLAVKGLPPPVSERDPLELQRVLPSLKIPWADDEQLDDALVPKEPFTRWLAQYIDRTSIGVAINDLRQERTRLIELLGSGPRDPRFAFRPESPQRVFREDSQGRRVAYWEYVFERTVIPQRAGRFSLGMVSIKGQFAARINTRGKVEYDLVYAVAPQTSLIVKQPPMQGRPATFTGAIGSFSAGTELSPVEARVGDPLTLTVWLRGDGTLSDTTAPDLAANAAIAKQFKMYEATAETDQDTRRFTYRLRPKTDDITQFPSISLSYFDVNQEQYVTLRTEPIPLNISAATRLASSEIAMPRGAARLDDEIGTLSEGIFANVIDLSQLRHDGVNPNRWFLNMGGMAGLFVVIVIVIRRLQRVREDSGLQRRKSAIGRGRRRIEAVTSQSSREVTDGISGAMVGLVADICDLTEEGLTSADAASAIAKRNVAPALVSRLQSMLETCDASRYASVGIESSALQEQARILFEELAQELRTRKLIS
jgi:hypothetical protein